MRERECVCVCVREREKEKERKIKRELEKWVCEERDFVYLISRYVIWVGRSVNICI